MQPSVITNLKTGKNIQKFESVTLAGMGVTEIKVFLKL
jgi:hypothetical protein